MDQPFGWEGAPGDAVLRMPDGEVVAGLVTLHGASSGRARQALFDQVGQSLTPLGIAVLSYERRTVDNGDTPLHLQAVDAVAAVQSLRTTLQRPVGLFGFSQGALAAALAAADEAASFLAVLGCSGVTPAEQMRFYTDELLRRRGFGRRERAANRETRMRLEEYLRGTTADPAAREALGNSLQAASREPWFPLAYLPETPPQEGASWDDMDFDPVPQLCGRTGTRACDVGVRRGVRSPGGESGALARVRRSRHPGRSSGVRALAGGGQRRTRLLTLGRRRARPSLHLDHGRLGAGDNPVTIGPGVHGPASRLGHIAAMSVVVPVPPGVTLTSRCDRSSVWSQPAAALRSHRCRS